MSHTLGLWGERVCERFRAGQPLQEGFFKVVGLGQDLQLATNAFQRLQPKPKPKPNLI
jgi:hypothetical protein